MASIRNKTARKGHDLSANVVDFTVNDSLQKLIDAEAVTAYKRPWHRLERGLRLNRLRAFADDMAEKRGLKEGEKVALLTLLSKALDDKKKLLNSKTSVDYDEQEEKIKEIKPLVMHVTATGEAVFQLLEKRNAVTFRKKVQVEPAAAQAV